VLSRGDGIAHELVAGQQLRLHASRHQPIGHSQRSMLMIVALLTVDTGPVRPSRPATS